MANQPNYSRVLADTVKELRRQLKDIEKDQRRSIGEPFNKDRAMAAAALGRSVTGLLAEMRQQEKHIRTSVEMMTQEERDALVLEWISDMDRERFERVRAHIDALSEKVSVLG